MHAIELEWIQALQQYRTPLLDFFFHGLRFFDRPEFMFVLIPVMWLNYGWKNGLRFFYILFFNTLCNCILKDFFASPRPYEISPNVGLFQIEGYGFPSGAAQISMLLAGLFVTYSKSSLKWPIAIFYVFFVSLSRVYLGVHFPSDIIGGWIAGLGVFCFVMYAMPKVEKRFKHVGFYKLLSLHIFVLVSISVIYPTYASMAYIGCTLGFAVGLWLCRLFKISLSNARGGKECLLRAFVGILGVFLIAKMLPGPDFFSTFLAAVWVSFFFPFFLCHKFFLKKNK